MDHRDTNVDDPIAAEKSAMLEDEAVNPEHPDEADTEETDILEYERGSQTEETIPAEMAAIHEDTPVARQASADIKVEMTEDGASEVIPAAKQQVARQPKQRSGKYRQAAEQVDPERLYAPKQAFELAQKTSYTAFDGAIEVHIRLLPPRGKKGDGDRFRVMVTLPHGTGKEPKIGVLDEALIEQIKKAGDTEFDVLLASPSLMPKVAQVAKILGPKGKMPNPKTGTVTDDPEAAKRAILSGRIDVRADATHTIHQSIGRVSWSTDKLLQNFQALLAVIPRHRLQGASVAATMGPGIRIELS